MHVEQNAPENPQSMHNNTDDFHVILSYNTVTTTPLSCTNVSLTVPIVLELLPFPE